MTTLDTLIKNRHGFVCGSDLYLHKEGFVVVAEGTYRHGPVDVFPCRGSSQNIVHHLSGGVSLFGDHGVDGAGIRAGRTKEEPVASIGIGQIVMHLEQSSVERAEPHCVSSPVYSLSVGRRLELGFYSPYVVGKEWRFVRSEIGVPHEKATRLDQSS